MRKNTRRLGFGIQMSVPGTAHGWIRTSITLGWALAQVSTDSYSFSRLDMLDVPKTDLPEALRTSLNPKP